MLQTNVDKILTLLKQKNNLPIDIIAQTLKTNSEQIEEIAKFLEEESILTIKYKLLTPYLSLNQTKNKPITQIKSKENLLSAVDLSYHDLEELVRKVKYIILKNKVKIHFGTVDWSEINGAYKKIIDKYNSMQNLTPQKKNEIDLNITEIRDMINSLMINTMIKKINQFIETFNFSAARDNLDKTYLQIKNLVDGKKRKELTEQLEKINKTLYKKKMEEEKKEKEARLESTYQKSKQPTTKLINSSIRKIPLKKPNNGILYDL